VFDGFLVSACCDADDLNGSRTAARNMINNAGRLNGSILALLEILFPPGRGRRRSAIVGTLSQGTERQVKGEDAADKRGRPPDMGVRRNTYFLAVSMKLSILVMPRPVFC